MTISWKVKVKSLSPVRLFATPWTVAYQVPQSMCCSRQECWSGLPFSSLGDIPDPGIEPHLLLGGWILYHWATWENIEKGETVDLLLRGRRGYRAVWGRLEDWEILHVPETHSPWRGINVDNVKDRRRLYLEGLYVPGKDLLSMLKDF